MKTIDISVWDHDRFMPNQFMGELLIDLSGNRNCIRNNCKYWMMQPQLGDYIGLTLGNYRHTSQTLSNYIGSILGNYIGPTLGNYIVSTLGNYIGPILGNYISPTLGNYIGPSLDYAVSKLYLTPSFIETCMGHLSFSHLITDDFWKREEHNVDSLYVNRPFVAAVSA